MEPLSHFANEICLATFSAELQIPKLHLETLTLTHHPSIPLPSLCPIEVLDQVDKLLPCFGRLEELVSDKPSYRDVRGRCSVAHVNTDPTL